MAMYTQKSTSITWAATIRNPACSITTKETSSRTSPCSRFWHHLFARGLAIGDLWNDGKLSAVISNMNAPPSLLVNQIRTSNHWIAIKAIGTQSNWDGIGARITVKAGTRTMVDEVRSGSSYDSNSDMRVHFGQMLAARTDWLQIRWPSGLTEQFEKRRRGRDLKRETR